MLPEFSKAKREIRNSQAEFFQFARHYHMGIYFATIPQRQLKEGNALKQVYAEGQEISSELKLLRSKFTVDKEELKGNPMIVYNILFDMAAEFATQQHQHMAKTFCQVAELTGNVVQSKGEYKIDHFFEALEKVEIDFDEKGDPILPIIYGGTDMIEQIKKAMRESETTPGNKSRMHQLIEKKREDWNDRERSRKLVD